MNAIQQLYASKNVTQKATAKRKRPDGTTGSFTVAGRVTGCDAEALAVGVVKYGTDDDKLKDGKKTDDGLQTSVTFSATDSAGKALVKAAALELLGFNVADYGSLAEAAEATAVVLPPKDAPAPKDKPAKDKSKDKPAPAPVS